MKNLLWVALIGMMLIGCTTDNVEEETKNQLLGKWELQTAERAGKSTGSLRGLYFEFGEDGSLKTNILTVPEEGTYELKEDIIEQRNTQVSIDYKLEELGDSTLTLSTNLRNTDFKFVLARAVAEE